jgi:hypothetical protein
MDNDDEFNRAKKKVEAKLGFYIHALVFVLVNAGLVAINLATDADRLWFQWPLIGWGAGLLLHAFLVFAGFHGRSLKEKMIEREMRKSAAHKS